MNCNIKNKNIILLLIILLIFSVQNNLSCKKMNIGKTEIIKTTLNENNKNLVEKVSIDSDVNNIKPEFDELVLKLLFESRCRYVSGIEKYGAVGVVYIKDNSLYFTDSNYNWDFIASYQDKIDKTRQYLYALDLKTKKIKWKFELNGTFRGLLFIDNGIYFGMGQGPLGLASYDYYIYKINADNGSILWKCKIIGEVMTDLVLKNNQIYFGTRWYGGGYIYSINSKTGKQIWNYKVSDEEYAEDIVVDDDYIVFSVVFGSVLKSLKISTKKEVWRFDDIISDPIGFSPPVLKNNELYFAGDSDILFYCLDLKTGKLKWSIKNKPRGIRGFTCARPQIVDDRIYFPDSKFFYAVDLKNRNIVNEFSFKGYLFDPSDFLIKNNIAYILLQPVTTRARDYTAYDRRYLLAVDLKTNKVLWKLQKGITDFIIQDDLLYFSSNNLIYQMKLPEITSSD